MILQIKNSIVILDQSLQQAWKSKDIFQHLLQIPGHIYRHEKNRKTWRFEHENKGYFIKFHQGVGWKEIFKNLVFGRLPVLGAQQERHAINRLEQLGVPTLHLAGFGSRGWNPARLQSFIITDELVSTISLEDVCNSWRMQPPVPSFKRALIEQVALIARTLHQNGVNHRDFYICHFLLDKSQTEKIKLYIIDLHRAQVRDHTPKRWIIKDIAGLYFSAMAIGLTQRDFLRFMQIYSGKSLRKIFQHDRKFWKIINQRATTLYAKLRT
jgi:heptose I phosphotransferase